jgi:starch-binding outer membrane protein, SusD/RagB family
MKTVYHIELIKKILILFVSTSLFSCKKFVTIEEPKEKIVSDLLFTSDETAIASVTGIYSQMMTNNYFFASGAMSIYPALSADEIITISPNTTYDPFANNNIPTNQSNLQNAIWRYGYNHIYQANACIEGLNTSASLSTQIKNQLLGEAKFIRAFCHFYLVNLFGDVPLITTTDYRINAVSPRTSGTQVYQQIITDLLDAQSLLNTNYYTSGKVRPNKWTAAALLARVYLYTKDYTNAEATASNVINSGIYNLVTNLNNVFLINSAEAIWQLMPVQPAPFNNTYEGFVFLPASSTSTPQFRLTSHLLNSFEPGDSRRTSWIGTNTVNSQVYNYPAKYKARNITSTNEYSVVFRLAEQYLIRAEARVQQNKIIEAVADLNTIRSRAGLANLLTSISQSAALTAVEQERRAELFAEWGHRWFDLKRTARADAVLSSIKTNWVSTAVLYPIPFAEIQANPNLIQNNGY